MKVYQVVRWKNGGIPEVAKKIGSIVENNGVAVRYICLEDGRYFCNVIRFMCLHIFEKEFVIHSHSLITSFISCLMACALRKGVVFHHIHGDYEYICFSKKEKAKIKIKRLMFMHVINRANKVLTVVRPHVKNLGDYCDVEKLVYVANTVEMTYCKVVKINRSKKIKMYCACRLDAEKNLSYLLMLVKKLKELGVNLVFDIYGKGVQYDDLNMLVDKLDLSGVVTLKGFTEQPDRLPLEYDFYLSSSVREGASLSCIRALACCNILVSTRVGDMDQGYQDLINFIEISGRDIIEDALKIERALSEVDLKLMAVKGHQLALSRYSSEVFGRAIHGVYEGCIG